MPTSNPSQVVGTLDSTNTAQPTEDASLVSWLTHVQQGDIKSFTETDVGAIVKLVEKFEAIEHDHAATTSSIATTPATDTAAASGAAGTIGGTTTTIGGASTGAVTPPVVAADVEDSSDDGAEDGDHAAAAAGGPGTASAPDGTGTQATEHGNERGIDHAFQQLFGHAPDKGEVDFLSAILNLVSGAQGGSASAADLATIDNLVKLLQTHDQPAPQVDHGQGHDAHAGVEGQAVTVVGVAAHPATLG